MRIYSATYYGLQHKLGSLTENINKNMYKRISLNFRSFLGICGHCHNPLLSNDLLTHFLSKNGLQANTFESIGKVYFALCLTQK